MPSFFCGKKGESLNNITFSSTFLHFSAELINKVSNYVNYYFLIVSFRQKETGDRNAKHAKSSRRNSSLRNAHTNMESLRGNQ